MTRCNLPTLLYPTHDSDNEIDDMSDDFDCFEEIVSREKGVSKTRKNKNNK